jgi:hypothetical protein
MSSYGLLFDVQMTKTHYINADTGEHREHQHPAEVMVYLFHGSFNKAELVRYMNQKNQQPTMTGILLRSEEPAADMDAFVEAMIIDWEDFLAPIPAGASMVTRKAHTSMKLLLHIIASENDPEAAQSGDLPIEPLHSDPLKRDLVRRVVEGVQE